MPTNGWGKTAAKFASLHGTPFTRQRINLMEKTLTDDALNSKLPRTDLVVLRVVEAAHVVGREAVREVALVAAHEAAETREAAPEVAVENHEAAHDPKERIHEKIQDQRVAREVAADHDQNRDQNPAKRSSGAATDHRRTFLPIFFLYLFFL